MNHSNRRLNREARTIEAMIHIYCQHHHGKHSPDHLSGLCPECRELVEYANGRLARCPFEGGKPTCTNCTRHCYKPEMRHRIVEVMRYSGPRMLYCHPILAILHLTVDSWIKPRNFLRKPTPAQAVPVEIEENRET
ncbi:MAG TPA: nitrous oxide-stimulated promoter family protein [Anaerolineaceae bacterium]|nr:nitrous oxide-stimulated promoter family protein [Anaerolineaceae bacterium]